MSSIREKVIGFALAGTLAIDTGCAGYHENYKYSGVICGEEITLLERVHKATPINPKKRDYILTVKKPDGRIIEYEDKLEDLILDSIRITENGKTINLSKKDPLGKKIIEEVQKDFNDYLQKILNQYADIGKSE